MGQHVSVDTAPLPLNELFVDKTKLKLRGYHSRQPNDKPSKFRSNVKAWSLTPRKDDIGETEIVAVDFTADDFSSFDSGKCYIVLHLFKKSLPDSTEKSNETHYSKKSQSLLKLAISASEQLTPRGVEHKFSTNDLQSVFFKNAATRFASSANEERDDYMNDIDDHYNAPIGYDLYLWHGKNTSASTQAYTVTKGYEVERRLLEPTLKHRLFDLGIPAPLSQFFNDDVPPLRSKSAQLQSTPSSSVALFMSLYQHCHLFRNLTQLIEDSTIDWSGDSNIAFRSLLQLPPDNNTSFDQVGDADDEDMEMQASPVNSPRTDQEKPKYDRFTSFSPTLPANFKIVTKLPNLNISSLSNTTTLTSPRKRPAPEGTKTSDSKRHIRNVSSQDSQRSLSSISSRSSLSSDRDRLRVNLGSVDQTERNDPSPTPRRMDMNPLVTPDSGRMMSGSELVVYYRKICSHIYDYLFLGSDLVARNKDLLQTNGVTHIVNAAKVVCDVYFPNDFSYHVLNLYDAGNESVIGVFFGVIDFIEKASATGGKVYIHCYEGVSRSTTLTIAYLMWKLRQKFNQVMEDVKKRRPVASPNPGFIVQLLQWEKMLLDPQTYLYRISPQNDKYVEHKHVVPKLCNTNQLDTRTCFILHSAPNKVIYLWIGNNCNKLASEGQRFVQLLKKYMADNETRIEVVNEGHTNNEFESLLNLVKVEAKVDVNNPYPDLEYLKDGAEKTLQDTSNSSKMVDDDDDEEEEEDEELEYADLYVYPDMEVLEGFDSEDLLEDGAYILCPQNDADIIYVWVGSEFASKKNTTMKKAGQQIAEEFFQKKNLSKDTHKVVIAEQDEEPEDFWNYFVNG